MRFQAFTVSALTFAMTIPSATAFASGGAPKAETKQLEPAQRYSGDSPIDLTNGIPGNNGTYGLRNAEYEAWGAQKKVVPSVNDAPYPYVQKARLVESLSEQVNWGETAISNWKSNSSNKEEVRAYAKQSAQTMEPLLEKLRDAAKKVKSAGENDWSSAEGEARKALSDFRAGYKGLHKNTN